MKAFIGWMVLTFSLSANAANLTCDFLDKEGNVIGSTPTRADTEAAAQVFAAASALVVLDNKLYVHEGFELGLALSGKLEPVRKISCY